MINKKSFKMASTSMFTAMIFLLTRFVCIPVAVGYVHFGDALVYIVASTLGGPYSIFCACVGEMLADITFGYVYYAPVTLIVKALVALPFVLVCKRSEKILTPLTAILTLLSGALTVLCYFIADLIINKGYAAVNITGNVIQALGSAVIFIVLAAALDTAKLKKKLFMKGNM